MYLEYVSSPLQKERRVEVLMLLQDDSQQAAEHIQSKGGWKTNLFLLPKYSYLHLA